jgi:hypothetical protein
MDDLQIGITGESEPMYCGCGCGQEVRGRHSVSHSLGNGRYTTYLAKHDHLWVEAHPVPVETPPEQRRVVRTPVTPPSTTPSKSAEKGKDAS